MGDKKPKIDGWMSDVELRWLYDTAKRMSSVFEVGAYLGKSTHALLSGCPGVVCVVDGWRGIAGVAGSENSYDGFMKNVGHFKNLMVLKMESLAASAVVNPHDMVFIDADHKYKNVYADISAWKPKARKIICGHDYDIPDVQRAVWELLGDVGIVGSIWVKYLDNAESV